MLALLAAVGVKLYLPIGLDSWLGGDARTLYAHAKESTQAIEHLRDVAGELPPLVIQTDYGDSSYYLGALEGAILKVNPRARIQVMSSTTKTFDIRDAAVTVSSGGQILSSRDCVSRRRQSRGLK